MEWSKGLNDAQVSKNLVVYGRNEVRLVVPKSWYLILISQISSPLVYVLLIASFISLLTSDYVEGFVILVAVMINTVFGFVSEFRAERSMDALAKLLSPRARVKRGDEWKEVDASILVPGDVVKLNIGWKIPADGLLIVEDDMYLNESILTGESEPIKKKSWKPTEGFVIDNGDFEGIGNEYKGFMGTLVERGIGEMLVVKTGIKTRMGGIAKVVKQTKIEKTPLQERLGVLIRQLTIVVTVIASSIFMLGLVYGRQLEVILGTSVALAVAAIPEGLVVGLTVILAVGMNRILKKRAIVRGLMAAETLGSVNVICLDKTGTITEGKMSAVGAVTDLSESIKEQIVDEGIHDEEKMRWLVQGAYFCNDLRDPLEISMRDWAVLRLEKRTGRSVCKECRRVDELPFDHEHKYIVTRHVHSGNKRKVVEFLSGAPEIVLDLCSMKDKTEKNKWLETFVELGMMGYRMVAVSKKELPVSEADKKIKRENVRGYEWLGVVLFKDPVRGGVAESLAMATNAKLQIKVITGDYKETGWSALREAGLVEGQKVDDSVIMTGEELLHIHGNEKTERIKKTVLFARTSPEQKLEIVSALQSLGMTVAMMGDGVNDVPALKKADIGITVDSGSDLAREVADLVLLDSNFNTILSAIEEGRGIFENLRKILLYLLADSFSSVFVVIFSLLMGWPLPLIALQILWINLVGDGLPYMALTIEPKDNDLLTRKPILKGEKILDGKRILLIGLISVTTGIFTLSYFYWNYFILERGLATSRTIAFMMQGVASLFYVFSCRSLNLPIWKDNFFKNKSLNFAVIGGWLLLALAIYTPWTRQTFGTVALEYVDWLWVGIGGVMLMSIIEIVKAGLFSRKK